MKIHIVKQGESLYSIAQKYGVSLEEVIALNPEIANPEVIQIGMKVKVPSTPAPNIMHQHTVQQGDTLWKLSQAWGVSLNAMIKANPQLKNPNALLVGEVVNIPKVSGGSGGGMSGSAASGGSVGALNKKPTASISPLSKKPTAPVIPTPPPLQVTEAPKVVQQQAEKPKVVQQQAEAPKVVQQQAEKPKVVQQQAEAPKVVQQQAEKPKVVQQQAEAPKVVQQQAEAPKMVQQQAQPPKAGAKSLQQPNLAPKTLQQPAAANSPLQQQGNVMPSVLQPSMSNIQAPAMKWPNAPSPFQAHEIAAQPAQASVNAPHMPMYGAAQAAGNQPHSWYGAAQAVENQPHSWYGAAQAVENQPHSWYGAAQAVENQPHSWYGAAQAAGNQPYPSYGAAQAVENQPHSWYGAAQAVENQPHSWYGAAQAAGNQPHSWYGAAQAVENQSYPAYGALSAEYPSAWSPQPCMSCYQGAVAPFMQPNMQLSMQPNLQTYSGYGNSAYPVGAMSANMNAPGIAPQAFTSQAPYGGMEMNAGFAPQSSKPCTCGCNEQRDPEKMQAEVQTAAVKGSGKAKRKAGAAQKSTLRSKAVKTASLPQAQRKTGGLPWINY